MYMFVYLQKKKKLQMQIKCELQKKRSPFAWTKRINSLVSATSWYQAEWHCLGLFQRSHIHPDPVQIKVLS